MMWYDLKSRLEDTTNKASSGTTFDENIGWGQIDVNAAITPTAVSHGYGTTGTYLMGLPAWPAAVGGMGISTVDSFGARQDDIDKMFPGSGAQVTWFNPTTNNYVSYLDLSVPRFGAGRGYFVKFNNAIGPQNNGYLGALPWNNASHAAVIHLYPGWNLIATPGYTQIPWNMQAIRVRLGNQPPGNQYHGIVQEDTMANVQGPPGTNKWLNGQRYYYDGATNASYPLPNSSPMLPLQGYWLQCFIECELLIPKP